ncbi:hypothetical protein LCGC14_0937790 [marine sediment metagenome]|uniref:Transcription regulator AsnC/Lrp ligand binding domain-containing protein n=1 Tax=marine sediment metagenome TaxID=412755 RepID=A0A0F9P745_9ZZZZ
MEVNEKQKILIKLNFKSKFNIKKISQEIGYTRQTFQKYLKQLTEDNVISNTTININPDIRPNLKFVLIEIKSNPEEPYLVDKLLKLPQLRSLDGVFGEFSLNAFFVFKSQEEFNSILKKIDKIMASSHFKKYQILETINIYKTNGIRLSGLKTKNLNLDETDYSILEILQEEQSIKTLSTYEIRDIMKKVCEKDISQSTIHNRIKNLEVNKIILNYAMNFKPKEIGFEGKFFLRTKPKDPSKYEELALKLEKIPEITDLYRIGEEYGLLAVVRVKKIGEYGSFIRNLYLSEEIEDTFTNFVLDELKPYTNFILF